MDLTAAGDVVGAGSSDDKLVGTVHSKLNWFSDMEESFMVNTMILFTK